MEANGIDGMTEKPSILVTNDDGIDASGLRSLVSTIVATNLYRVFVCAPDRERSAASHSLIWQHPLHATKVEIEGALAYAVSGTPADCASLGISGFLFPGAAIDLVISGINCGNNTGYSIICSGTVGGAREAFLHGIPSVAISTFWGNMKNDLGRSAEICMPVINSIMQECKCGTYPAGCFINIDLPGDLSHHKGFKITRQARTAFTEGWSRTSIDGTVEDLDSSSDHNGKLWFKRINCPSKEKYVYEDDEDVQAHKEGFITITPLSAFSNTSPETRSYLKECLQKRGIPVHGALTMHMSGEAEGAS